MSSFKSLLHGFYIPWSLYASANGIRHYSEPVKPVEPNDEEVYLDSFPPKDSYQVPKNPIVLCHGLSGFDKIILIPSIYQLTKIIRQSIMANNSEHFIESGDQSTDNAFLEIEYWIGVKEKLEKKGCTVLVTKVPSFGSIEERALSLHAFLEKETQILRRTATKNEIYNVGQDDSASQKEPGPIKLNLIAHSMGGLDCRFLISKIQNKNYKVLSLTTVSTPHRGSEMADYVVNLIQDLKKLAPSEPEQLILPPSIRELTTKYMSFFNATTPNDPSVSYFSYGSCFRPRWYNAFYMTWKIIHNLSGGQSNDGMVTVQSSKWGHFRGCLLDTDHLDIINWKNKLQKDFSKSLFNASKAASQSLRPDIDILNFYLYIADDLARRGF
ncbi:hypothetical protein ZYGR_0U03320 [Zygosaccharomyces rouxii]|uniref:ZYRO0F16236p n=3 Tax=Zygosaccharomyces rouxii TaxID=4956 RepID=C5DYW3_ZYGRC|nr:uncharacterized protein ZYRO0F16236g [Zygosaccharomyces rouxii]KAH9201314.1 Alpha/Beta hydrolase protein [Zygosaccharomyces rouxii]GAV50476.1 hypothetical protein ZYGR_0U03320 [Zygosaccharomyces rouxii]CAR28974.1 ZYRO0F16236p [Zygosaccharomyces rouxii]